ncbi:MAG: choice-of-anchor D domain-containing protein [Bacteroidota bacterium]
MQQLMPVARTFPKPWHLVFSLLICLSQPVLLSQPVVAQELQLSVEAITFPTTFIGDFSEAIVTYENVGEAPVTFDKIDFSDTALAEFEIVNSPSLTALDPGEVRNVRIRFTPVVETTLTTFLVIETIIPDEKYRVALEATGELERLRLSIDALAFGALEALSVADTMLVLENPSDGPITITSLALTDTDQPFSITGGDALGVLAAGASRTVDIRFAPQLPDTYESAIEIEIAEDGQTRTVPITATGIAGTFAFTRELLEFESTILLDTSQNRIQFVNTSPVPLIVTGYQLEGAQASSFEITTAPTLPLTVLRGDRPEININFSPQIPGLNEATLVVQTNTQAEPLVLPIVGEARAGVATPSVSAVSFNRVTVGMNTTATFTITNTGFAPFTISERTITGTDASAFSIVTPATATALAPNEVRTLAIQFAPQKVNEHEAELLVYTGLPESPVSISLAGLGGLDNSFIENEMPATGKPLAITVRKSSVEVWNQQTLYFRRGGETTYQSADLIDQGDRLEGLIPLSHITQRGVDYYIELSNNTNTLTIPTLDAALNPFHLRVQTAAFEAPLALSAEKNRMVSIPLLLDEPQLKEILEDDYGEYNNRAWRLHRWNTETNLYDEYDELALATAPGQAFWLVTREGMPFDFGSGFSVPANTPFAITLAPGWNQIANPFAFPISWQTSFFTEDPGARELIEAPVAFDGEEYLYDENILQPWWGYFVFNGNETATQAFFRPIETGPEIAAGKSDKINAGPSYRLQLSAAMPHFGLVDTQNFIGFDADAHARREAPPLGDHVQLSVISAQTGLSSKFVRATEEGAYWDVAVSSTIEHNLLQLEKRVDLSFAATGSLPEGFEVHILDTTNGHRLPAADSTVSLVLTDAKPTHNLRIVIGTSAFAAQHSEASEAAQAFALHSGYPNPFQTRVSFPYTLSEAGPIELSVFDLLGRRVALLAAGQHAAGAHIASWDGSQSTGKPAASGVYIVHLKAGAATTARRIVLSR